MPPTKTTPLQWGDRVLVDDLHHGIYWDVSPTGDDMHVVAVCDGSHPARVRELTVAGRRVKAYGA